MILITCAGCNNKYSVSLTQKYRNKRWCGSDYCKKVIDQKVKHKNYKIKIRKINNGTYKNGVVPELRKEILRRDNYTCNMCANFHFEDGYSSMQVHHIIPVSEGRNDEHSNLITLCHPCHKKVHSDGWENYVKVFRQSVEGLVKEKETGTSGRSSNFYQGMGRQFAP